LITSMQRAPLVIVHLAFGMLLLLVFSWNLGTSLAEDNSTAIVEGAVYDMYGAVITNIPISVENTGTGDVINLRTDDSGRYSTRVQVGTYKVSMRPSVGYPIGYEHASFTISPAERVVLNFRPKPFSISDSIESGHWIETYIGSLPNEATHFVQRRDGAIKDLRLQYQKVRTRSAAIEYKFSVTASFDKLTVYANRVIFHTKEGRLTADGNVLFEDGQRAHKTKRIELNLLTTPPVVTWNR
jgi:hypothetical protein